MQLLCLFQHLAASDPRDKFFAFRNLHTAAGELPAPDYNKSANLVFEDLARWLLENTNSLSLFALDLRGKPAFELPTWTPNFATPPPFQANYWRSRLHFFDTYDCARSLEPSIEYTSPGLLRLRGSEIDQIKLTTSHAFALGSPTERGMLLREWYSFANAEDLDDVFCATMIAGCAEDDDIGIHKARAEDIEACREFLAHLIQDPCHDEDATSFGLVHRSHITAVLDRRLFQTRAGRLGVGHMSLRGDDEIWILAGGKAPFVLRPKTLEGRRERFYELIGHAYVHGVMHGECGLGDSEVRECLLV